MTTPGQTVGPFFGYALPYPGDNELVPGGIRLHGSVRDGAGEPVPDALLEIWQPDADGRIVARPGSLHRDGATFTGFGRASTDAAGDYWITTVAPPRFIAMTVFARGLLDCLFTRVYLADDPTDPLLAQLPPERRRTLIAVADDAGLRFDVVLQGEGETVFLAYSDGSRLAKS